MAKRKTEEIKSGENKSAEKTKPALKETELTNAINTEAELKNYLLSIRDRMTEEQMAPIYAVAAVNHVLTSRKISDLFNNETKEIARDIWLRIKRAGFRLRYPPFLFGQDIDKLDNLDGAEAHKSA